MRPIRQRSRTLLAALIALSLFGCSPGSLGPSSTATGPDPGRAPWGMGTISLLGDTLGPTSVVSNDSNFVFVGRDSFTVVTQAVDGLSTSVLSSGCVRLDVPVGAIRGAATIQMKSSMNGRYVQLEILPADRNGFDVPVRLSTNCSGAPLAILENLAFFWIDPANGDWVLVDGSTVDLDTGEVSAPLKHFSEYRIGNRNLSKAGW